MTAGRAIRAEAGFTMVATLVGTTVMAALALAAVTAVRGDIPLYSHDIASKRAFEAAKAGVEDYAFHLYADSAYWTKCTETGTTNAINQKGSTTKRRKVPGDSSAEYAIELIPATGQTSCSTTAPTETMIETSGPGTGSFRIKSTGFVEGSKASITATFKRPSFLDYVYFTQLETSDPVSYGYANPSSALTGAYEQCELSYEQGRYNSPIPNGGGAYCNKISFVTGDQVKGPMHTNDTIAVCGSPEFGRTSSDVVEIGGKSPGWFSTCSGSSPKFTGTRITSASILVPPETNSKLKAIAEKEGIKYSGQVRICLSGTTMTVGTGSTCTGKYSGSIPTNGVLYVENAVGCSTAYSPFTATYPSSSSCGNVYVHGTYTGQLTIAAENDIVIDGDLCRGNCGTPTGTGLLGLIANNFVRVYHAYSNSHYPEGDSAANGDCGDGTATETSLKDIDIDAALLAIKHSFIVDHYNCGPKLENLNVEGAIAQKFRGPVGTSGGSGSGYFKNYNYDDRLRYLEPPSFIEPSGTSWVIGRETEG